jgi:ABC-type multidrug transport system ATPase subunit
MTPLGHTYEELTGLENLHFAARMNGDLIPSAVLEEALEKVGLGDVGELTVHGYSTGMRKRLELARIGLREPDLVLLDEPFTSLDAPGIELMQDAIGRWRAAGTTVLIASHRVEEAARHADRTVRLANGVITDPAGSS